MSARRGPARAAGGRGRGGRPGPGFVWRGGVKLARVPLWFDAPRVVEPVVLSAVGAVEQLHAGRVVATPETFALRAALQRHGRAPAGELRAPYGRPFALGPVRLELFPSGRHLGAAACLIEVDGRRLVYAGELGPADTVAAAPAEVREAECLALWARQASPRLAFPPRAGVWEALRSFVESTLRGGAWPVLVMPPLGAAQEVAHRLADLPLAAHPTVARACARCRALGADLPAVRTLGRAPQSGEVVLWPERTRLGPGLPARDRTRVGLVSAAALDAGATAACGADEAFPLASQADFETLGTFVAQSGAREVALIRGADPPLVDALRARGVGVRVLGPPLQMELFGG
ncbi:MAG: hypothetical protein HY906_25110 [Deltaproteobacteria bacterium]|nr:hypothetical protein [Deltaproteobacteria bacterium]